MAAIDLSWEALRATFEERAKAAGLARRSHVNRLMLPWIDANVAAAKPARKSAWWLRVLDNPWMTMIHACRSPDPDMRSYRSLGWPDDVRDWLARSDGFAALDRLSDAWATGEELSETAALGRCAARIHVLLADRAEAQGHSYLALGDLLAAWQRHARQVRAAADDERERAAPTLAGLELGAPRRSLEPPMTEITSVLIGALRDSRTLLDVVRSGDGRKCIRRAPVAQAERRINRLLAELVARDRDAKVPEWCFRAMRALDRNNLDDDQFGVARAIFGRSTAAVLHGPPGTGKTHTCAAIIAAAAKAGAKVEAVAPTGRAAGRLRELLSSIRVKGVPSPRTVHALLGSRMAKGADVQMISPDADWIMPDLLVVDESSMLDTELLGALLRARDPSARLLLVGDPDQLQPVGCGEPFRICCARADAAGLSGALRTVHRAAADAPQTALARAIHANDRSGVAAFAAATAPGLDGKGPVKGALLPTAGEGAVGPESLPRILHEFRAHCRDRRTPPMVIVAQHDGEWGTRALNAMLKDALNPVPPNLDPDDCPKTRHGLPVTAGDRVIWTGRRQKFDDDRAIVNGDFGTVVSIRTGDDHAQTLKLRLHDGTVARIRARGLSKSLEHGWAITCHRAQGSEAPLVVYCPEAQNPNMVYRNLAYTAITRPREMLVLIGDSDRMAEAFHDPPPGRRTLPALPEPPAGKRPAASERQDRETKPAAQGAVAEMAPAA